MKINKKFILPALGLFLVETFIAIFIKDNFIRPIFGDFLSVIFLYYLFRCFLPQSSFQIAFVSLMIAYLLEIIQYFHILKLTGLDRFYVLRVLAGTSFSWGDILAYTLGFGFILLIENSKKYDFIRK